MAGQKGGLFKERFSPFLREKLDSARSLEGLDATTVQVIESQYLKDPREDDPPSENERRRHYEADMSVSYKGHLLRGVERLYRRVILIEPTTVCAAHCRWCLRGQYPVMNLLEEELDLISRYCGDPALSSDVREILITGGDPFMIPDRLKYLLDCIEKYAPNIEIARIGSRVPVQDPQRVNDKLLSAVSGRNIRIEVGTHVNHSNELFPEVRMAYKALQDVGVVIYNQAVLLKDMNDSVDNLLRLFDELRYMGIETHYLFHCIPMRGMNHHRTTIEKGLELIRGVTSSGAISGRCKPMFTAMTDIGKITLYDGVTMDRDDRNRVLLQSHYSYDDRRKWNPRWQLPDSASIDADGYMQVWYLDGQQ